MPIIRVRIPRRPPIAATKRRASSNTTRIRAPSVAPNRGPSASSTLVKTLALTQNESEYIWNECLLLQGTWSYSL